MDPTKFQPNGRPRTYLKKPPRKPIDSFFIKIFPDTDIGQTAQGLIIKYLIKQEARMGWAYRGACSEVDSLLDHPIESVASHMWGVSTIISDTCCLDQFKQEIPIFNELRALKMAQIHDVGELITSDITPDDKVPEEIKKADELAAMNKIMSYYPAKTRDSTLQLYHEYEAKETIEAQYVKDCDRLDFMITAFLLERQGFSCVKEFYENTISKTMYTKIALEMAELICNTRDELFNKGTLYATKP